MSDDSIQHRVNASLDSRLDARLRLAGKLVSKRLAVPRVKALDALAQATRHDSWRSLNTRIGRQNDVFSAETHWMSGILEVLGENPMGFSVGPTGPFSVEQLQAAEGFWRRVATELGANELSTLDSVAAKLFGVTSWRETGTLPLRDSVNSLYSFVIKSSRKGNFIESRLALALNGSIGRRYFLEPALSQGTSEEKDVFLIPIYEQMLVKHPGYVSAAHSLAQIWADAQPEKAADILATHLALVDSLIPPEFTGRISFRGLSGEYYRKRWLLFALQVKTGKLREACDTTRVVESNLTHDTLGFSACAPMAHLALGNIGEARKLLKRVVKQSPSGGPIALSAACMAFVEGKLDKFREYLFLTLGSSYELQQFLESGASTVNYYSMRWNVHPWPVLLNLAAEVFRKTPALKDAVIAFTQEAAVKDALRHIESQMALSPLRRDKQPGAVFDHMMYVAETMLDTRRDYARVLAASPAVR
jgi:hypothetical protein